MIHLRARAVNNMRIEALAPQQQPSLVLPAHAARFPACQDHATDHCFALIHPRRLHPSPIKARSHEQKRQWCKMRKTPSDSAYLRMLLTMKADIFAARSLALATAVSIDLGNALNDSSWKSRAAFLTPIAKSFGTEIGCRVAEIGIQVHGGIGFTWEHPAHLYFKKAKSDSLLLGTPKLARDKIAELLNL